MAIEIDSVSEPICLLSGCVVVVKTAALNPPVAADCMADAGERICVPLLPSALLFSFAAVCIAEAGEKIGSLRLPSASLSAARFPSVAAVCAGNSASLL